jgi:hypothetical protein
MELMTEPGPRMRDTLRNSTTPPPIDHDHMWTGVQARHSTMSRRRTLFRWAMLGIAGAVSATGLLIVGRTVPTFVERPVNIAADSVQEERPITFHAPAIQETPSAIIPLLGHRTQLRVDIDQLSHRRTSLLRDIAAADVTPPLRAALRQELAEVEEQLAASKAALVMVDRQLAGHSSAETPVATSAPEAVTTTRQIIEVPTFINGAAMIPWFAGGGTLIMLMMIATMLWVRRTTRAALNEVASLRMQAGTQLTALSEGIEAIAVEVERIGESQRYISKAIATPNQRTASEP